MPDTLPETGFDLERFLPYLLNQAAEATSKSFQQVYRSAWGMTRTQWRVLANLGKFGAMTARDICARSHIEKTKVSRAVQALADRGMLQRAPSPSDGRAEILSLSPAGREMFADLGRRAIDHDRELRQRLGPELVAHLDEVLRRLMTLDDPP